MGNICFGGSSGSVSRYHSPTPASGPTSSSNATARPGMSWGGGELTGMRSPDGSQGTYARTSDVGPRSLGLPTRSHTLITASIDGRTAKPGALPSADNHDAPTWFELPSQMAPFAVARFGQDLAARAHYGSAEGYEGSCVGFSALWVRLHHASPQTSAVDRVNVVGSYDSLKHADACQQRYVDAAAVARQSSGSARSVDATALRQASENWGMQVHASSSRLLDAKATARAVAGQVNGYALLTITPSQNYGRVDRHVVAVHHQSGAGVISVFDADCGEFKVPKGEFESFLRGFSHTKNRPIDGYGILHVDVGPDILSTPLAHFVEGR